MSLKDSALSGLNSQVNPKALRRVSATPPGALITGGTRTTITGYIVESFTGSGQLTVQTAGLVDILVVGGGVTGGGGGAVRAVSDVFLTEGTYTVTVGGAATESSLGSVLAGRGGNGSFSGNAFGQGSNNGLGQGGRGGANAAGSNAVDGSTGGAGGAGLQNAFRTGSQVHYGGGGGGGGTLGSGGAGGQGGGGAGGRQGTNGTAGQANTGGGGGTGGSEASGANPTAAGAGGSGIVVVRAKV